MSSAPHRDVDGQARCRQALVNGVIEREPQGVVLRRAVLARDNVLDMFLAADAVAEDVHEFKVGGRASLVHSTTLFHHACIVERR
jgi:hypothetical protein